MHQEVTAMMLSHAHIDHSGLISKIGERWLLMVKLLCTPCYQKFNVHFAGQDSAVIQRDDARFVNKKSQAYAWASHQ